MISRSNDYLVALKDREAGKGQNVVPKAQPAGGMGAFGSYGAMGPQVGQAGLGESR